jgi:hypothetical protein
LNNGDMNKRPHVFTWDNEPADERPSAFQASTCGPTESWFDAMPEDRIKAPRRPPQHGLTKLALSFTLVLSLCGFVMVQIAHLIRG